MEGKTCKKCKTHYKKIEGNFYHRKEYKGGYDTQCIKCRKKAAQEYYKTKNSIRLCKRCKVKKPISEFDVVEKGYRVVCKDCRAEEKERFYKRKKEKRQAQRKKELQKKREKQAYKKLVSEPQDKGIGDKEFNLVLNYGQVYKIIKKGLREGQIRVNETFVGKLIQITDDFFVLRNKNYSECFLKKDYLLGEIEIEEV